MGTYVWLLEESLFLTRFPRDTKTFENHLSRFLILKYLFAKESFLPTDGPAYKPTYTADE